MGLDRWDRDGSEHCVNLLSNIYIINLAWEVYKRGQTWITRPSIELHINYGDERKFEKCGPSSRLLNSTRSRKKCSPEHIWQVKPCLRHFFREIVEVLFKKLEKSLPLWKSLDCWSHDFRVVSPQRSGKKKRKRNVLIHSHLIQRHTCVWTHTCFKHGTIGGEVQLSHWILGLSLIITQCAIFFYFV